MRSFITLVLVFATVSATADSKSNSPVLLASVNVDNEVRDGLKRIKEENPEDLSPQYSVDDLSFSMETVGTKISETRSGLLGAAIGTLGADSVYGSMKNPHEAEIKKLENRIKPNEASLQNFKEIKAEHQRQINEILSKYSKEDQKLLKSMLKSKLPLSDQIAQLKKIGPKVPDLASDFEHLQRSTSYLHKYINPEIKRTSQNISDITKGIEKAKISAKNLKYLRNKKSLLIGAATGLAATGAAKTYNSKIEDEADRLEAVDVEQ